MSETELKELNTNTASNSSKHINKSVNKNKYMNFLDTPEALHAKHEAETGKTKNIGNLHDFDNWVDNLVDKCKNN